MEENISQEKKGVIFELGIAADTPNQPSSPGLPSVSSEHLSCDLRIKNMPHLVNKGR